jgi:hypothetical protein
MPNFRDEEFMRLIADRAGMAESAPAPSHLKARIYSSLMRRQAESGPLMSLTKIKACGEELCIFEELVRIAPLGEKAKSLNICRTCHARVLAEHIEDAPIYWNGCPYVALKKS